MYVQEYTANVLSINLQGIAILNTKIVASTAHTVYYAI